MLLNHPGEREEKILFDTSVKSAIAIVCVNKANACQMTRLPSFFDHVILDYVAARYNPQ
jgi:hypothetical protein